MEKRAQGYRDGLSTPLCWVAKGVQKISIEALLVAELQVGGGPGFALMLIDQALQKSFFGNRLHSMPFKKLCSFKKEKLARAAVYLVSYKLCLRMFLAAQPLKTHNSSQVVDTLSKGLLWIYYSYLYWLKATALNSQLLTDHMA